MFDGDYSKKVWIISIIMAIGAIGMDLYFLLSNDPIMKEMSYFTLPLTAYILFKCIQGLKKKIDEENGK